MKKRSSSQSAQISSRRLPNPEQIKTLAKLLGPDLTNIALMRLGEPPLAVPVDPQEVRDTITSLSSSLTSLRRLLASELERDSSNYEGDELEDYIDRVIRLTEAISKTNAHWEQASGHQAVRANKAFLVTEVTAAIVDSAMPRHVISSERGLMSHISGGRETEHDYGVPQLQEGENLEIVEI